MRSLYFSILPLLLTAAPSVTAQFTPQTTLPGWSPWMLVKDSTLPRYETGFSNADASQFSAWSLYCTEIATAAKQEATYWHRVSDFVGQIGTGYAGEGCVINNELYGSSPMEAIKTGLKPPVCLQITADVGNGLVLRREPNTRSDRLQVLPNGSTVQVDSLPALQEDDTKRQWLYVNRPQAGWVSAAARLGDHINLRLCR